jgi:hypothetical protein
LDSINAADAAANQCFDFATIQVEASDLKTTDYEVKRRTVTLLSRLQLENSASWAVLHGG